MVSVYSSFVIETWAIPASWFSQIYAIGWNTLYWMYLVYLYVSQVAWIFLEDYFEWFFDLIGSTVDYAWFVT
jgi:hypothetical protein